MDIVEAWRGSNKRRCRCQRCFYCDRKLDVHQHDHYPVPRRAGGTHTVPACPVCHDLKDRIPSYCWDGGASRIAFDELFLSRIDNLRHLDHKDVFAHCYLEIEAEWHTLSPLARLMYAKMRSVFEDDLYLGGLEGEAQQSA